MASAISDLTSNYSPHCLLCSRYTGLLAVSHTCQAHSCLKVFALAVSLAWIALTSDICMAHILTSFKKLKHHTLTEVDLGTLFTILTSLSLSPPSLSSTSLLYLFRSPYTI